MLLNAPVTWGTQFAAISEALWVWSEFDGKYSGCQHWSEKAWNNRAEFKQLRHDHAVPQKVILERLGRARGRATEQFVREVLDAWCIGVVITRDEDASLTRNKLRAQMPIDWDKKHPWARYEAVGIVLKAMNPGPRAT